MRDELDILLDRVDDPALRAAIAAQVDRVRAKRQFGLVFESHLPERVRLPDHPIRPGATVTLRAEQEAPTWEVLTVDSDTVTGQMVRHPDGTALSRDEITSTDPETLQTRHLVAIAEFGEPIYPGLRHLGSVHRGGDKPAHTVIKGENYHALEALQFTHAGKVDCIYIDPPYNTGARDWKYNNRYVDENDGYRHSKWLSFMERRLFLAKKLLNPDDSVLIVTIDEKEYLRLGLLLEQVFPEARSQMVSSVISFSGASRSSEFARTDEYLFFVAFGAAGPAPLALDSEWKVAIDKRAQTLRWSELLRSGTNALRTDRPHQFYPVFVSLTGEGPAFHSVGSPFYGVNRSDVAPPEGCVAIWPIRSDGSEGRWQISPTALQHAIDEGYARLGQWREDQTAITYLKRGERLKVARGDFEVTGRRPDGSIIVDDSTYAPTFVPGTQWRIRSHSAEQGGTNLLKKILPGHRFPFPKSLYAVEDAIRFFVADKPDAVVLDFFAGSGTTAHAVMRLNKQDAGRRQCISVTNNEVSADEAVRLSGEGFQPGDPDWEALGIFEHITRPRIEAAVTGLTPDGEPIRGDYKFTDEFPMADGFDENVEFFELTYQDPDEVELDAAFDAIAPLLWLRAGAHGEVITETRDSSGRRKAYAWTDQYAVLFNPDRWRSFVDKLPESVSTVFVVTNSQSMFSAVAAELPTGVDVVRLYENYLSTFAINAGHVG